MLLVSSLLAVLLAAPVAPEASQGPERTLDPASVKSTVTGADAVAAKAISEGRAAMVLKSLTQPRDRVSKLLRLVALSQAGRAGETAAAAEALLAERPNEPLAPRVACIALQAFETLGDAEGVVRHAPSCAVDPIKGKTARVQRVRALLKLDRRDDAGRDLETLLQSDTASPSLKSEAHLLRAELLSGDGRTTEALEELRRVYIDEPVGSVADRARAAARDLSRSAKLPPPDRSRLLLRAEKLMAANMTKAVSAQLDELTAAPLCSGPCPERRCERRPDAAAAESDPASKPPLKTSPTVAPFALAAARDPESVVSPPQLPACALRAVESPADPESCRIQLLRGLVARKGRSHGRAFELLRAVYDRCADPEIRARAAHGAAASAAALKDPDAWPLALIAATQFPGVPGNDEALLTAANQARERGERLLERSFLRRLVTSAPDSEQRAEALFRLFWSHRAEGHPERGLAYLETLSKEFDAGPKGDGGDAERGRYWWGRTVARDALGPDRARGLEALTLLARERPLSYYGLLARSFALSIDPKAAVSPVRHPTKHGPLRLGLLEQDSAFSLGVELLRLGLTREARDAFGAVDYKALRGDGRRGRESAVLAFELIRTTGDDRLAHALARRELAKFLRDVGDPLVRRASLVAYPLVFRDSIHTHASSQGFAPDFLQGLMREESALDPLAKSPVGARGLTQLMPATAQAVAKSIGLKRFRLERLWEPDTNIQIGSVYLGRMLKLFGHPGLAAAAYNAGPGAVARWLSQAATQFDEFVEEIPYSETRGYVKRVLRSYGAYQYLYGAGGPAVSVGFAIRSAPDGTTQETGLH